MHGIREMISFRARLYAAALAATLAFHAPGATAKEPAWTAELAPYEYIVSHVQEIGRTLHNELLARMIVSASQAYFTRSFGNFRTGDPIRFAAYRFDSGKEAGTEVALIYPSVDKVAKMILHHPGAEKTPSGNVSLPLEKLYAVFSEGTDGYCAFATSEETASAAARAAVARCPEDAIAHFAWRGGSLSVCLDGEGLYTKSPAGSSAPPFAEDVAWLSIFAVPGGGVHRIDFEDLKKLVLELVRQTHAFKTGEGGA